MNAEKRIIELTHGNGGKAMHKLIDQVFLSKFDNRWINKKNDQALFQLTQPDKIVMTTDSFVVSPLFFPGGSIGSLAVHGTINDVCMSGAEPRFLSATFIIEEGFPIDLLEQIAEDMARTSLEDGVPIVTGDTKVVEKGKGDGVFITTTGIGEIVEPACKIGSEEVKVGDQIITNGYIGDHGIAIMAAREGLEFDPPLRSDCASLHTLVKKMVSFTSDIHCLRDPTRGGIAATLNEIASSENVGMLLDEEAIPLREEVLSATETLGLDPLYLANEGKIIAFCAKEVAEDLVTIMKEHPLGENSHIIGEVTSDHPKMVEMKTGLGGKRLVSWLAGDPLPRIC